MVGSGQMQPPSDARVERIFKVAEQNCLAVSGSSEWVMPEADPVPLVGVSKFHPYLKPLQPAGQPWYYHRQGMAGYFIDKPSCNTYRHQGCHY